MFGLVMSEDRLSLQPRRREIIQVHILVVTDYHHDLHRQDDGQQNYLIDILMQSPQIRNISRH